MRADMIRRTTQFNFCNADCVLGIGRSFLDPVPSYI